MSTNRGQAHYGLYAAGARRTDVIFRRPVATIKLDRRDSERARCDEAAYRDYRDHYRALAASLGLAGHMKWAEAMP